MKHEAEFQESSHGITEKVTPGSHGMDAEHGRRLRSCRPWGIALVLVALAACGGGGGSSGGGGGGSQEITSIRIEPNPVEVGRGSTETLDVTAETSDGDTVGVNNSDVDWEFVGSTDSPIASVTDNGEVTGKQVGNALIRAHFNEHMAGADLAVSALQVRPASTQLPLNCRERLRADSVSSLGVTRDITADAEWSVSNDSIGLVTPDKSDSGRAEIEAKETGSAVVRAQIPEPGSQGTAGTARVEMVELSGLTDITIENPGSNEIAIGEKRRLAVAAVGTKDDWNLANCVLWSSDPEGKVSISADGVIRVSDKTAEGEKVTITANYRDIADATLTVEITGDEVTLSIGNLPPDGEIDEEETRRLEANATITSGSDSRTEDVTDVVYWSSDRPEIAFVGNAPGSAGRVKGLQADPEAVTITADMNEGSEDSADPDLRDSTPITVLAPSEPTDLTMSAEPNVLLKGGSDSSKVCARLLPNDTVPDGTEIKFTQLDSTDADLDSNSVSTENGEACVSLTSGSQKENVEVKADETESGFTESTSISVVDSFASVFDESISDATTKTFFEAIFVNGSNRQFDVNLDSFNFCTAGDEDPTLSEQNVTDSSVNGGGRIRISVETNDPHDNAAMAVKLTEPDTQEVFALKRQFGDTEVKCNPK